MVEPFAAVLLNTVHSGRLALRHGQSLHATPRVMSNSSRVSISSDFFTPLPRHVKGKGKAVDSDDLCSGYLAQCQEWSCCATKHSLWCSKRVRLLMMMDASTSWDMPLRRNTNARAPNLRPVNDRKFATGVSGGQKRHSSHLPEVAASSSSQIDSPDTPPHLPDVQNKFSLSPAEFEESQDATYIFQGHAQRPSQDFNLSSAWESYLRVLKLDAVLRLPLLSLLMFTDKLLLRVEEIYDHHDVELSRIHHWGDQIQVLLKSFSHTITPLSRFDHWYTCLLARSAALSGKIEQAVSLVQTAAKVPLLLDDGSATHAYEGIIRSIFVHQGNIQALDFILSEWSSVGVHLIRASMTWDVASQRLRSKSLRVTAYDIIARIDDPAWLIYDRRGWDKERLVQMGSLLILVLCKQDHPTLALDVLHEMQRQNLIVSPNLQLTLVRALVREDMFGQANVLYASMPKDSSSRYYYSTGLYLYAHQGDDVKAAEYYDEVKVGGWASAEDMAMKLFSFATQGRAEETVALFDKFFPRGTNGVPTNSPTLLHYSVMILAHARKDDLEGVNVWLKLLSDAGWKPDIYVFSIIMRCFAMRGDMDSIDMILSQMRTAGVYPNLVSYTTIITLLAHRKDPVGAEAIYRRAIREGIVPDRRMIASVMNAHVEAGSWAGAIRIFDYLQSSGKRANIAIYNTLLKAYILMGSPFRIVSRLFTKLLQSRLRPDDYSFAMLMQSACDAGEMDQAVEIFAEMERLAEQPESDVTINVYVMTILMAGFLRLGNKVQAKAVYDDMLNRGIQPTSVTYGTMLKAYGNEKTEESMQLAEKFIKSLLDAPVEYRAWDRPNHGRKTALDHIYGPVIYAYARQEKPEEVERMYQEMIDAGGEPSLGTLSSLLDAYRRAYNIDAVVQLWPQILELGLRHSEVRPRFESDLDDPTFTRLKSNILCIPLSIYIDALSAAGRHIEIAAVWKKFQIQGFAFDSHNWNHLIVALIRAGEPERAFEILERVILPYQRQSQRVVRTRNKEQHSPLSFEKPPEDDGIIPRAEGPFNRSVQRAKAVRLSSSRTDGNIDIEDEEHDDDFAHPLHILHQISPSWSTWRPHNATLSILLIVVSRLRSGALIEPVKPYEDFEMTIGSHIPGSGTSKIEQAQAMVKRIYINYPDAMRTVMDYEVVERRRLGRRYDTVYNWW